MDEEALTQICKSEIRKLVDGNERLNHEIVWAHGKIVESRMRGWR